MERTDKYDLSERLGKKGIFEAWNFSGRDGKQKEKNDRQKPGGRTGKRLYLIVISFKKVPLYGCICVI